MAPLALANFVDGLDKTCGVHSYMVLRDGVVIGEGWWAPYRSDLPHSIYSVSKSVTSVAVGFAVGEGHLGVDDRVVDLLPEDRPRDVGERLAALRVRHLLTMTTGHAVDTVDLLAQVDGRDWARTILAADLAHEPGEKFVYNSGATFLLSVILARLTGETLLDYLVPRLFDPLGIRSPAWQASPSGTVVGGWGLKITTEDLATFGEFCRREGEWDGAQLLPAGWMQEASAYHVATDGPGRELERADWRCGYGFQFWRSQHGYRADGAFGQFAVVLPEQRVVIALTSGLQEGAQLMDLVWQRLFPGVDDAATSPTAPVADALTLPPPVGSRESRAGQVVLALDPPSADRRSPTVLDGSSLDLRAFAGSYSVRIGYGDWLSSELRFPHARVRIAAAGAWTDEVTWVAKVWLVETPYCVTVVVHAEDEPRVDIDLNASFGATEYARLTGRWVADAPLGSGADEDGWTVDVQVDTRGAVTFRL